MRKFFTNHTLVKGLISRLHNEIKININKTNYQIKMGYRNRVVKPETQMIEKH